MLDKVSNDFHSLVIGTNEQSPRASRPSKPQVASKKPKAQIAEAEQVAMAIEMAEVEVVAAPEAPVASNVIPAPGPYATVDNCGMAPPGVVAGPAGRFFPVPARPVFSPQYGGCELR